MRAEHPANHEEPSEEPGLDLVFDDDFDSKTVMVTAGSLAMLGLIYAIAKHRLNKGKRIE